MTALTDIALQIEGYAKAAFDEGEKDLESLLSNFKSSAASFVQKVEDGVSEAAAEIKPMIVTAFHTIVAQFGQLATQLVLSLAGAAGAGLSGTEKANLAATSLVQAAWEKGVELLSGDVSALIKNAWVAIQELLAAKLAPSAA